jgi:signal transduction histidine kinase
VSSRVILGLFVTAAVALLAAIVFNERSSPDAGQHDHFQELLADADRLDQAIARHALASRFGFEPNYDTLARADRELLAVERGLDLDLPTFPNLRERQQIRQASLRYQRLSTQRLSLLERFKSENALFRNSAGYFPSAVEAVLRQTDDPELIDEINELRGLTLSLALEGDAAVQETRNKSAARVTAMARGKLPERGQRLIASMLAHARAMITHKAETDRLLAQLLEVRVDGARGELDALYWSAYARAGRQGRMFGHFVSGLSLLLLAIVAYAGLRLQRAAAGLGRNNERLEGAVAERTAELQAEMTRRAHMELELRHAQKLEAIGQLASGIAHEINTPIQYVGDSIYFLRHAFADVMRLVDAYGKALLRLGSGEGSALQISEDVDVELLRAEVPEAFERTADGIRQVASIVKAMKTFAHASPEKLPVDLNAAVENTLSVARNEYKYVADLQTELGQIPDVTCNAGGIRQVLLNLIVNAAHAIADKAAGADVRGTIRIKTELCGSVVRISIADTGAGIPEAVRGRIFEPFFTTKAQGRGTGQGLAISRSIITQHGGKLWFETELGQGTTFFVQLPIEAEERREATLPERAA